MQYWNSDSILNEKQTINKQAQIRILYVHHLDLKFVSNLLFIKFELPQWIAIIAKH